MCGREGISKKPLIDFARRISRTNISQGGSERSVRVEE